MDCSTNSVSVVKTNMEGDRGYKVENLHKEGDEEINRMNRQGYKVISVTPLTGGSYVDTEKSSYGISFTIGILIGFKVVANE